MDKIGVYERIKKLADELTQSDTIFDRADLTSELHEFGVLSDSLEVSDLVRVRTVIIIEIQISEKRL